MLASLASHALHLGLEEVRGRSDASNKTLSDIYHSVGCKRIRTGLSSTSNIESVEIDTSSDFIEWAICTSDLIHALARPPPPSYRVRRVSAPLPPFNFVSHLPQHPSSAHPESLPSASLSQAASAAFVRGDVDSAKLLWQQLLQVHATTRLQRSTDSFHFADLALMIDIYPVHCALCNLLCRLNHRQSGWSDSKRCRRLPYSAKASEPPSTVLWFCFCCLCAIVFSPSLSPCFQDAR